MAKFGPKHCQIELIIFNNRKSSYQMRRCFLMATFLFKELIVFLKLQFLLLFFITEEFDGTL